jgi:hypothetical protein
MSKQVIAVSLATAVVVLIAAQSLGLFGGRTPTLISPASFPLIVPALLGVPPWLVAILWGASFVIWHPALLQGSPEVPSRTVALWLAAALLSGAYFVASWRAGRAFEGAVFTRLSLAADVVVFGVCSALLWRARTTPSFERSLSLHAGLFIWISTYAFPYLGEAP